MTLRLDALTAEQCEQVRLWRNQTPEVWRTPHLLTSLQQQRFYEDVVSNRQANARYWALMLDEERMVDSPFGKVPLSPIFVGMVGLVPIQAENGLAELSMLVDPGRRRDGIGRRAVELLLDQAFNQLRLEAVVAEVYMVNPAAVAFWSDVLAPFAPHVVELPNRKFYGGTFWPAKHYTVLRTGWVAATKLPSGQNT